MSITNIARFRIANEGRLDFRRLKYLIPVGSGVLTAVAPTGVNLMLKRHELAALWPSDPQICQRVFDRFCVERHFERASEEARDLATLSSFSFKTAIQRKQAC
ncbi:hypothetical protein [Mesorhizobium amorphae]|uniref:hypothetical protein n=1 Tax=Mesorhizobium amorphae TaxID=71433 RepID=UPI00177C9E08|nr:hypothetical protein [Mesorhizobium amorphae]